ncbi:MAG: hypothetical protein NVSMB17_10930 [Candidatus Dormibacteria bacterium]
MASQPSDRLKAMVAAARAMAEDHASAPGAGPRQTADVEPLLDRARELPDARALARMYRDRDLDARLPDDADPPTAGALYTPPPAASPGVAPAPARAPLSPAQVRAVMGQLSEQFGVREYTTFAPRTVVPEVVPPADEPPGDPGETRDAFYLVGTLVAIIIIAVFIFLALRGPLRYSAPAPPAGPSPSSVTRR